MTARTIIILEKIVKAGVLLGLLVPLVVTPGLVFPFHTGRTLMFQAIVELLLVPWLILIISSPTHRPRRGAVLAVLGFYAVVLVTTTLTGIDPSQSFWGSDQRMMGVFTLFHLIAWALMAASVFQGERAWRLPLTTAVGVATAVALASIHEHFFPGAWRALSGGGGRTAATFGNPIFLANYLVPHIFLTLWLGAPARKVGRILLAVAAGILILGIVYSQTRGAAIGFAAGVGMLGVGWIAVKQNRQRAIAALVVVVVTSLLAGGYVLARREPRLRNAPTLAAFLQISPELVTVRERKLLWQIALRAWESRPLLGFGPENFDYGYDRHYDPRFLRFALHETWVDRAHNIFLDSLVTMGPLGLLASLGLLMVPTLVLWNAKRAGALQGWQAIAAIGLAFAVLVQNMSAFDTLGSVLVLMLFVALGIGISPSRATGRRMPKKASVAIGIVAFLLAVAGLSINARTAVAARALSGALHTTDPALFRDRAATAIGFWHPYQIGFRLHVANKIFLYAGTIFNPPAEQTLLAFASDALEKSVRTKPDDLKSAFVLGNIELIRALDEDPAHFGRARQLYNQALSISPRRQIVLFQLGNLELVEGEYEQAVETFGRAVAADPESNESWWHLGRALVALGNHTTAAYEAFERGRSLGYEPVTVTDLDVARPIYVERGDLMGLLWLGRIGVRNEPRNADRWAQLAAVAAKLGLWRETRSAVAEAVRLDPSIAPEAEKFLETIPK